ncbi:MAG: AAA family ATPase, partial [Spirochaetales bacterium]|nr:AAA family ATPase [Spirochaetales bacterium]
MKKVPYGIASFEKIKEYQDYYYIDKTRYIEELENLGGQFIFFLRPRRFGKSLFLSMLESYYDIARKDQFESLFGDTYIGQNPTPLKNSFPILKLNFSGIAVNLSEKDLAFSFALKIRDNIISFYRKYSKMYNLNSDYEARYERFSNAGDILNHFIEQMYDKGVQYYMLIDEYDNFANNILIHHG